ncbi:hypothetical protein AB0C81_23045 [Streptomyces roseoverticillatus]|uniref:hypothetical protein n=1 Tax=Streptomyces roseoverticillatus TaxID=66429 RepID=UPI0033E382E3
MEHELRAEYIDGRAAADPIAEIKTWHVVREDASTAMCGRELEPAAQVRSADDWATPGVPVCHSCGALYLREQP